MAGKNQDVKNITSVEGLQPFAGQVIKYSPDGGKTWIFGRLWSKPENFGYSGLGFSIDLEVSSDGVHGRLELREKEFGDGWVAQPTTPEETRGKKFSYENLGASLAVERS